MIKVLNEERKSITFSMVRGYYEKLWNEIYPHQPLPIYLRADTSDEKFEKEIARHIKRWEAHKQIILTTRSGRVGKKKKL